MSPRSVGAIRFRKILLAGLGEMKLRVSVAVVGLIGVIVTELLAPWPLKIIFDYILLARSLPSSLAFLDPLLQPGPTPALIVFGGAIAVIALLNGTFSYLEVYANTSIGHQLAYNLRRELFGHLAGLSLSFHSRARSGELLTKVANDTGLVRDVFGDWALTVGAQLLTLIGMLAIMFAVNWELTLVVVVTLPVLVAVLTRLNRKIKDSARRQRHQEGRLASRLSEVLTSMAVVQAFGREGYEQDRFEVESAQNLGAAIQTSRMMAAMTKSIAVVTATGTAATVFLGAWLVLNHRMSPGDLLIFIAYVGKVYKPVRDLGKLSGKFSRAMASAHRIAEILETEPDIRDDAHAIAASRLTGDIVFRNVSFAYDRNTTVLDEVSFHIMAGQRVALVGASGTGKSTVVSLLLRLYEPLEGSILIDGVDIRRYQRESLRREIGIVLQDTVLFGASIRENIAYGKPHATLSEVEDAARQAHAHDFITSLPDGYDTVLGERGATLSGGQRQRICLARAVIKRPSILILDEPTSAVDPMSASLIEDAIGQSQQGRTTLVIAHRFASMSQFDQILVLKDGAIVEHGRHDRLIASDGHYTELARGAWA